MSLSEPCPAHISASERRAQVCDPPPGPFDKDCSDLRWVYRKYSKEIYLSVFIYEARLPDFLEGERRRGGSSFYKQVTSNKVKKENDGPAAASETSKQVNSTNI
jgi:hypothetical protein